MKKLTYIFVAAALLLSVVGCSSTNRPEPLETLEPAETLEIPDTTDEPINLTVSDLNEILLNLDISGATLTFYREEQEDTHPAAAAIRAENYIKELQDYTWETYTVPTDWDINDSYRCYVLTCDGLSLTVYYSAGNVYPLHVITESGDGWFILPAQTGSAEQLSNAHRDTFNKWCDEARSADLNKGTAIPLTAEELTWFQDYTYHFNTYYDEKLGGYITGASAISCFFTSYYSDPRDMVAEDFLRYCPPQKALDLEDEEEFRIVLEKVDWLGGEDLHLLSLGEMPVPCHRFPRTYLNEILTQYAGITVEDMNTDWKEELLYVPETDCFYNFTSDFAAGTFFPYYGEKDGDIVTLWQFYNTLTLQKSGDNWIILSHQAIS